MVPISDLTHWYGTVTSNHVQVFTVVPLPRSSVGVVGFVPACPLRDFDRRHDPASTLRVTCVSYTNRKGILDFSIGFLRGKG